MIEVDSDPAGSDDAANLFDLSDDKIDMASIRRLGSRTARPPTSESEETGLNTSIEVHDNQDIDSDDDKELLQGSLRRVSKGKNVTRPKKRQVCLFLSAHLYVISALSRTRSKMLASATR